MPSEVEWMHADPEDEEEEAVTEAEAEEEDDEVEAEVDAEPVDEAYPENGDDHDEDDDEEEEDVLTAVVVDDEEDLAEKDSDDGSDDDDGDSQPSRSQAVVEAPAVALPAEATAAAASRLAKHVSATPKTSSSKSAKAGPGKSKQKLASRATPAKPSSSGNKPASSSSKSKKKAAPSKSKGSASGSKDRQQHSSDPLLANIASPKSVSAARDARALLQEAVQSMPITVDETTVRSFGRLRVLTDPVSENRYATAGALYPVGFSCDRYEFSPVHGRTLKIRCSILDGKRVKDKQRSLGVPANQQVKADGPVFRLMWGQAIDEDSSLVEYPYLSQVHSAPITSGPVALAIADPNSAPLAEGGVAGAWGGGRGGGSKSASRTLEPSTGMRVRVRFEKDEWHNGTIVESSKRPSPTATSKKKAVPKSYVLKIRYDDTSSEEISYPDPDVALLLPGVEEEVDSHGNIELSELNGKPVTSVTAVSPIEAWGKALVKLGLIDEIIFDFAMDQLTKSRIDALEEAKKRLEGNAATPPPAKSRDATSDQQSVGSSQDVPATVPVGDGVETAVDAHPDSEPPSEREKAFRAMTEDLKSDLIWAIEEDVESMLELSDARIQLQGPLLCNPFHFPGQTDYTRSQQESWLATAVRKEKLKMGSTGNRKKLVTALDLLERNDTLYNTDIEALIEGLPGSEYCNMYVFKSYRGNAAMNRQWMQEAQLRREKELAKRANRKRESEQKVEQERERLKKRKERDDVRDAKKKQRLEEEDQKKRARIDERLGRLKVQVEDKLQNEASVQREKVVSLLARNQAKEFVRRRKAAETVAAQSIVEAKDLRTRRAPDASTLPLLYKSFEEDTIRIWNFLTTFGFFFIERGYISEVPTLDALQSAIDTIRNGDGVLMSNSDATSALTDVAVALCKPLAASLTRVLFASLISLNPTLQKDFGAAFFNEVNASVGVKDHAEESAARADVLLPVNSMTWQEVARLSMLADALGELGFQRHEAAHLLRGYRSAGHPTSKEARRLRKGEDMWIAILRQEVELGGAPSRVESTPMLKIDIPCPPLCSTNDFLFYLHSIKSLPDPLLQDVKMNLVAALSIVQSDDCDAVQERKADLLCFLSLLEEHAATTKESKVPRKLKTKFLHLFDKYAGEASSEYATSAFEGMHTKKWLWLEARPKESTDVDVISRAIPRERVGQMNALLLSQVDYKRLSQNRAQYMESALRWKEEEQLKTLKDEEDEEDEEDDDDDGDEKDGIRANSAEGSSTERQVSDVMISPNGGRGNRSGKLSNNGDSKTSFVEHADRIGKPTEYDDFCGDIPTAPEPLRRCLAVLRTLCCSTQASGFLNPVDPQSNPAYYESVLQPMCLREVGQQLYSAAAKAADPEAVVERVVEDAVVQFGRNVRLIEHNTLCHGNTGPTVISMASELLRIFERLFLDWVLAPEHLLLPLGDLDDDKCVDHHVSDEESTVLFCDGCEGKYNISRLDPPLTDIPNGDWYCHRCLTGRWWGHIDPRVGKHVRKIDSDQVGVIKSCQYRYHGKDGAHPSLMYMVELGGVCAEAWSLEEVNEALSASGTNVPPIRFLEAVAESPGYGNGVDIGLRQELVPVASNPRVSENAAHVSLSSSVFRDTIAAASTLMIVDPEDMTANEWLRLLALLTMNCSSSDVIQTVVSKMENSAAESVAVALEKVGKVSSIKDILPDVSCVDSEVLRDAVNAIGVEAPLLKSSTSPDDMTEAAVGALKVESSKQPGTSQENGSHHTVLVEAVEFVEEMDVEPSVTLSDTGRAADILVPATEVAVEETPLYAMALLEKKRRRKTIEDSISAYCIKTQLKPTVASFEEDRVSQVVDSVLNATVPGLDFASVRCRRRNCDFCGLLDLALGAPLVRVPNQDEWTELMSHAIRNRRVNLVATVPVSTDRYSGSSPIRVAVKIRIDGELFSVADDDLDHIPDGGMLEFIPRADTGFQSELLFRDESDLPFMTGSLSAHECCAVAAHNARKELMVQLHRERQAELIEKEAGMKCGRTLEIGSDAFGRSYWKFSGDDSLFVFSPDDPSASSPVWQRFEGSARVASVLFALSKEEIVEDLKKVFPRAAAMLRDGSWKNSLLSQQYPTALNFAEVEDGDAVPQVAQTDSIVLGGLDPYAVGENVLVESKSGTILWDAVISGVSRRKLGRPQNQVIDAYRVEYKGWNSRFTEWVEPKRVVEPNENNRLLQEELDMERAASRGGLPVALNTLTAKNYFLARDRVRGSSSLPDFDRVAQVNEGSSSSDLTFGLMKAAILALEAALPLGSVDNRDDGPWNPRNAHQWRHFVETAPGPARLMQCVILLEDMIGEDWIIQEVGHLRSCLPARWKAILEATSSSLAVRIILLDRSLRYGTVDKKRYRMNSKKKDSRPKPSS